MANGPDLWPNNRLPHPELVVVSSQVSLSPVPDQGHPTASEFLQPSTSDDFSVATHAYLQAKNILSNNLTRDQLASIEAVRSIHDLHSVACKAQERSRRRSWWSRGHTVFLTLDRYKSVLDVLAQAHPQYTSLAWGAIKWILTVAMNYMSLLEKISTMLEDIGHRLPRIQLYQNLLPSKRLASVISELYAAIIGFFTQTVLFFSKPRTRKFFSIFYGPLEAQFRDALERIARLSGLVEEDARAAAVASQHAANTALSLQFQEVTLITRHAMQSVLEVKKLQTQFLLQGVRMDLFHGNDQNLSFQYDMMKLWTTLVAPEWSQWYLKDMCHVPFYQRQQDAFSYVQTDQLQILTGYNIVSQKPHRPDYAAQTALCWAPSMTVETALASLIYQYLEQYPEKLLFSVIIQATTLPRSVIAALPGSRCMMMIPADTPEAATFVTKMMDLCEYWSSHRHSVLISHITDPTLSNSPKVVELDNEYDLDPGMDTGEGLFRVLMMALGVFGDDLTEDVQTCVWSSSWRSLRYNLIAATFHTLIAEVEACFQSRPGEKDATPDQRRLAEASLKRTLIAFFQCVERDMPDVCRASLTQQLIDHIRSAETPSAVPTSQPLNHHQYLAIWHTVEPIFKDLIALHFPPLARDQLSSMQAMTRDEQPRVLGGFQTVEEAFSLSEWHETCLRPVQHAIRNTLQHAAAAGLAQIMGMYMDES